MKKTLVLILIASALSGCSWFNEFWKHDDIVIIDHIKNDTASVESPIQIVCPQIEQPSAS